MKQIADFLVASTRPRGLAVRINAVHMCKTHRGVRASHNSRMINTVFCGAMEHDSRLKQEFLQECLGLELAN